MAMTCGGPDFPLMTCVAIMISPFSLRQFFGACLTASSLSLASVRNSPAAIVPLSPRPEGEKYKRLANLSSSFSLFQRFEFNDSCSEIVAYPEGRRVGCIVDIHATYVRGARQEIVRRFARSCVHAHDV